jgi:hypothetical protein
MKRPNAVSHMMGYGLILGFLLCMLFLWSIIGIQALLDASLFNNGMWGNLATSVFISCIVGAIPGLVLGYINGWFLWHVTYQIEFPLNSLAFQKWSKVSGVLIAILTFIGMAIFTLPAALIASITHWDIVWLSVPVLLATFAAFYGVHRYMLKLHAWSQLHTEKPKTRRTLKHQLAYDDDATDDEDYLLLAEIESQQDNLTHS